VTRRWRVDYESAPVDWIRRQSPPLLQVIAAVEWSAVRKSLGPPADAIPSPDPEYPEDRMHTIALAQVDVLFLAYEGILDDPLIFVRRFASY
jgi:hypothetical protein